MLRRLTKSASRLAEMTAVEVSSVALRARHEATAAAEARVSEVEVRVEARQSSELAAKKAYAAVAAAEARVADLEG